MSAVTEFAYIFRTHFPGWCCMSSSSLTRWPVPDADLALALEVALAFGNASMGLMALRDGGAGTLHVAGGSGLAPSQWPAFEPLLQSDGVVGIACTEARRICRSGGGLDAHNGLGAIARSHRVHAIDVHPLSLADEGVVGAVVLLFRWPKRPSAQPQPASLPCCRLIARALDSARRHAVAEQARDAAQGLASERLQFVARMSHELRTPLQSIVGYLDLLRNGVPDPVTDRQLAMMNRVAMGERVLMSVIDDLDSIAALETGQVRFTPRPVSVGELVRFAEAVVAPLANRVGVPLDVDRAAFASVVVADERKATQVLINLLTNAVKFSPQGATVRLRARRVGGRVRIDVVDSGPGIPRKELDRIFDPYVQLARRVPRGLEGFGLGLAISRQFAEGMGGRLSVASAAGCGTTFSLHLPTVSQTPASRGHRAAPRRASRRSRAPRAPPSPAGSG
jgi:signal transduction histidine kinase